MANAKLLFAAFLCSFLLQRSVLAEKKPYIVYLGGHRHDAGASPLEALKAVTDSHYDLLGSLFGNKEKAQDSIFYSYTNYINGFAANLEEEEALQISKRPEVLSVFPSRGYKLHTTHSWSFLGLERDGIVPQDSLWTKARFGQDTIIGNLDTGVWPEAESFNDEGMGPIPSRWKGVCQIGSDQKFSCNRKLIGARYFNKGYQSAAGSLNASFDSPRDNDGHGTHTLSTAGGGFVPGASVLGYGSGTAKGGSPRARVAAYKVCWPPINGSECFDADILAAFDAAIKDGVDVLSVSLGGDPVDYSQDGLAIGSFHAVKKGIPVVCSAGNSGPALSTVSNLSPWMLTVGASTIDREFPAYAVFGKDRIKGESLSTRSLSSKKRYSIISSKDAKDANATKHDAKLCFAGSLEPAKVKGKIVVCVRGVSARVSKGVVVDQAGGAAMILVNDPNSGNEIIADAHILPATHVTYSDGLKLFAYLKSTNSPTGFITRPVTQLGTKPAPFMAAFSSQGPNVVNPEILKPDITAPGVSIIAAYTEAAGPTDLDTDTRRVAFNSESGTSMSCPHMAGVVGLLKSLYPHWSPAAIKSAIMTTARTQDNLGKPITNSSFLRATPFGYGAGHVWPNRAMDPGLVYDLTAGDYMDFLCAIGYNATQLSTFSNGSSPHACPSKPIKLENLNYPSIAVPRLSSSSSKRITRTLKNVGAPGTYAVRVQAPPGVKVTVKPKRLAFAGVGEEKKFQVTLKAKRRSAVGEYAFGRLIWSDGKHNVRTPVVVKVH